MISTFDNCILHSKRGGDSHTVVNRARDRATFGVEAMNALGDLLFVLVDLEIVRHMDTPDDEYIAFLLNLAYSFGGETAIACRNVARLQRAPKRAGQSTCGRSHHIIKRGGVPLLGSWIYPIMLCYLRVKPEKYRLFVHWEIGAAQSTLHTLDPDY